MVIRSVCRLFLLFLLGAISLTSCTSPVVNPTGLKTPDGLTIRWSAQTARSIYPATYPTPATYDLLLKAVGQADVTANGITGASWSLQNLARVNWTITVTGKDSDGNAIVQGGTTADLTNTPSQTSSVVLQYLATGTGNGEIHLTLDLSEAPGAVDTVTATITDPSGSTTYPAIRITGGAATFTLDPAPVGAYSVYFFVEAGTQSQGRFETVMVFQNVDTAATMKFPGGNFDTTFHPVTGVALDHTSLNLFTNGISGQLSSMIRPANATNPSVAWKSSAPAIATVTQQGVVIPLAEGTTTVSVATTEGSFIASCEVTVAVKHVTGVTVLPVNLTLVQQGSTGTLVASAVPVDASPTTFAWSSSDTSVATVDGSGVVTPLLAGTATMTATSLDGSKTGSSSITVLPNGVGSGTVAVVQPGSQTVSITAGPRQDLVTNGTNPTFTGVFSGTAISYQWFVDGQIVVGATQAAFVPGTHTPGAHTISLAVTGADRLVFSSDRKVNVVPGFLVSYDGNGATGGTVPVDTNGYPATYQQVVILGNSGNLVRTGYQFAGWTTNNQDAGPSTTFVPGVPGTMASSDMKLYAVWIPSNLSFRTGTRNFITGGATWEMEGGIAVRGYSTAPAGSVVIPPGVTDLIPEVVGTPGKSVFFGASGMTSVNIPTSVRIIGQASFAGTGLTSIVIPTSVTSLAKMAFYHCLQLQSAIIPGSVSEIRDSAFEECPKLTDVSLSSGLTMIGIRAFMNCTGLSAIHFPDTLTSIWDSAFENTGLITVYLPPTLLQLGGYFGREFANCVKLTSATINGDFIWGVGTRLFLGCTSLASVTVNAPEIGLGTFANCTALTAVTLGSTVGSIDSEAFYGCTALVTLSLPSGLTTISPDSVWGCSSLTGFSVDAGNSSFSSQGGVLFDKTGSKLVRFPTGLGTSYSIPSGVTSIGDGAFLLCTKLPGVTIPTSVSSLGDLAFYGSTNLASITMLGTTPPLLSVSQSSGSFNEFDNTNLGLQIHVPSAQAVVDYQAAPGWSRYSSSIVTP